MKLTTQQIDKLYTFTRQHYVEWYDLQSELVDHLANAIEQEWEQNPNRTFEEILNKEFQKFGVFGFMGVVEERQKFLNKKYSRLIWSYYKEFFGLPKIILTVALVYGIHIINQLIVNQYIFPAIVALFLLISGFFTFRKRYYLKQKANKTGMKWLFEDIMINRVIFLLFSLPSAVINLCILFQNNFEPSKWSLMLGEIAFVLVVLLVFIQLMIVPKRVAEDLAKTYPEFYLQKA
jgi:hypothetical protein